MEADEEAFASQVFGEKSDVKKVVEADAVGSSESEADGERLASEGG